MKNFKRILLALVAVFAVVLLVGCGAKSDNGTYVYKPTKSEVKEILEEQGAPSSSVDALIDNVKLEVSVTIKDKKGSLKIKGEMMGQKTDQSFDMKVDQQKKTLQSKTGEGEKVNTKYQAMYSHLIYLERKVQITQQLWKCSKTLNSNAQNNTKEKGRGYLLFFFFIIS